MITENLSTLKIYKLTEEQYAQKFAAGDIEENAIYLTPENDVDPTLSIEGSPADAKATGDAIKLIKDAMGITLPPITPEDTGKYLILDENNELMWSHLPQADGIKLGIVKPIAATEEMISPIGVDNTGALWTKPSTVAIDNTLTKSGQAADAGAVGAIIQDLKKFGNGVLIVHVDTTSETPTLDKTFDEIITAIGNGFSVVIKYHTIYLPLAQQAAEQLTFLITAGRTCIYFILNSDNTTEISVEILSIATATTAGLVKPEEKTEEMTHPVGIDSVGKLWTQSADLDLTVSQSGQAADAGAVRAELDNLTQMIQSMTTGGLTATDDGNGNVEIIVMPLSWSIIDDDNGNIEIISATAMLPNVTSANEGQFMRVINGKWATASVDCAETKEF